MHASLFVCLLRRWARVPSPDIFSYATLPLATPSSSVCQNLLLVAMATPTRVQSSGDGQCVTSFYPNDVLFGRGSGPNDHEGNVFFRRLVRERKAEYMNTNHRQTKTKIAREIVDTVRAKNGRFLKKMEAADAKRFGIPKGADAWCTVDEDTVMEKAKQALRQKAEKEKEDEQDGAGTPRNVGDAYQASIDDPIPLETQSRFRAPMLHVDDSRYSGADQTLNWQTRPSNLDPIMSYGNAPADMSYLRNPSGCVLPEEAPPRRVAGMNHHGMVELNHERLAEVIVHSGAAYDDDEEERALGDGVEDDERRKSLQVEDLMQSFNEMGTSSSSNANQESSETMGTIDPLPMGSSNVSMMSSSTFSIFKGAMNETPRSSFTRASSAPRQDASRLSFAESSRSQRSEASDMSLSLSNEEALWEETNRTLSKISHVSKGYEGDSSAQSTAIDPRPVGVMQDRPDSMSALGQSSMTILNAVFDGSGDSSRLMGTDLGDMHGDSPGNSH